MAIRSTLLRALGQWQQAMEKNKDGLEPPRHQIPNTWVDQKIPCETHFESD